MLQRALEGIVVQNALVALANVILLIVLVIFERLSASHNARSVPWASREWTHQSWQRQCLQVEYQSAFVVYPPGWPFSMCTLSVINANNCWIVVSVVCDFDFNLIVFMRRSCCWCLSETKHVCRYLYVCDNVLLAIYWRIAKLCDGAIGFLYLVSQECLDNKFIWICPSEYWQTA